LCGTRGDVGDGADLQAGSGQGTDGGLTAGAGTLDEHVDLAHAVLHGAAGGGLGGHLGGERGGLARALEADLAGDAHEITAPVGSVIETIVLLNVLLMCAWPWA
jgi:hypothetical protein